MMKQGRIVSAYKTLTALYKVKGIPFGISCVLYNVKQRLEPYVECQDEQEIAMAEEISDGMNPDGTYKMDSVQRQEFFRRLDEIMNTEVEYDHKPVRIQLNEELVQILGITGEIVEVLDGFVIIEVDGKTAADYTGGDNE